MTQLPVQALLADPALARSLRRYTDGGSRVSFAIQTEAASLPVAGRRGQVLASPSTITGFIDRVFQWLDERLKLSFSRKGGLDGAAIAIYRVPRVIGANPFTVGMTSSMKRRFDLQWRESDRRTALNWSEQATILTHSSKVHTRNGVPGWQGDGYDEFQVYGDQADPMGSAPWRLKPGTTQWERPTLNLHGHNRNLLGGMPPAGITSVGAGVTTTISLAPLTATSGTRLIYLPMLNRAKFYVEYRPATGIDSPLTGQYAPGAGVYLRMVNTRQDAGPGTYDPGSQPPWWPDTGTVSWTAESWEPGSQAFSVRQGHITGESMSLPDGTMISVGALSPSAAQVRITRPADTSPPTFDTHAYLDGCYSALDGTECALRARESAPGEVQVDLTLPRATDDQWVSSLTVTVDGAVVVRRVSTSPGLVGTRAGLAEDVDAEVLPLTLRAGSRVVTVTATDLSGLTYAETTTVVVTALRPASAPTGFRWQRFADDEIGLYWTPPTDAGGADVRAYQIEQSINGGEWTAEGWIDRPEVLMTRLPQDTSIRFRVAAETEAGRGAWGVTDPIVLPSRTVPSAPQGVMLTPGDRSIEVRWQPPENDGGMSLTGYTATASNGASCGGVGSARACTIVGLDNGVAYTVSVVATNGLGDSEAATAGPATPVGLPGKVTGLRGKVVGTTLRVTWGAPADTGGLPITGYRYRIGSQAWRSTTRAALELSLPRRTSSLSISVQAGNSAGYGPVVTVKARR